MRQWTIDAFADAPFRGNPACVLEPLDAWPADDWMQALAAENNASETAFLRRTADPARFDLRWFTPTVEVPLCGHATLGSSHALMAELGLAGGEVRFATASGELTVRRHGGGYEMDFPAHRPIRIDPPAGLAEALGAPVREAWISTRITAVLESEAAVRGLEPDLVSMQRIADTVPDSRGNVCITAQADAASPYDAVSRYFAPGSGIPEDPATGSAHCTLMPLWGDRLGRSTLRFFQAYPGRGAHLECELRGERVLIRGEAVTVAETTLRLSPARTV
jgi:PhzF family phenazine biosynthesis protein